MNFSSLISSVESTGREVPREKRIEWNPSDAEDLAAMLDPKIIPITAEVPANLPQQAKEIAQGFLKNLFLVISLLVKPYIYSGADLVEIPSVSTLMDIVKHFFSIIKTQAPEMNPFFWRLRNLGGRTVQVFIVEEGKDFGIMISMPLNLKKRYVYVQGILIEEFRTGISSTHKFRPVLGAQCVSTGAESLEDIAKAIINTYESISRYSNSIEEKVNLSMSADDALAIINKIFPKKTNGEFNDAISTLARAARQYFMIDDGVTLEMSLYKAVLELYTNPDTNKIPQSYLVDLGNAIAEIYSVEHKDYSLVGDLEKPEESSVVEFKSELDSVDDLAPTVNANEVFEQLANTIG